MLYHAPTGSTDPNAPYIGKNVAAGIQGSKVPPGAVEYTQREIVNAIANSGQTPTDSDLNQLTRTIRGGQLDFDATDTGTADAMVAQVGLAHTQIQAGLPFTIVKGPNANTGNAVPTLTITDLSGNNGLTGTIVKATGAALAKGDLPGGALLTLRARAPGVFAVVSLLTISDVLASLLITTAVTKTVFGTGANFPDLGSAFAWLSQYKITSTGSVTFQLAAGKFPVTTPAIFSHPDGARVSIVGAALQTAMPMPASFALTGNSSAARTANNATNLATLRGVIGTELAFTAGASLSITSNIGSITNMLLTGDGSQFSLLSFGGGGQANINNVCGVGAGSNNCYVFNAVMGVFGTCFFSGAGANGVLIQGGFCNVSGALIGYSNASSGVAGYGGGNIGCMPGTSALVSGGGNGANGFSAQLMSSGTLSATSTCVNNGAAGVDCEEESVVNCAAGFTSSNNNYGFYAVDVSKIGATNTAGSGNGTAFAAYGGSLVSRSGSTCTGTTTSSPAVGTVGNSNALVS